MECLNKTKHSHFLIHRKILFKSLFLKPLILTEDVYLLLWTTAILTVYDVLSIGNTFIELIKRYKSTAFVGFKIFSFGSFIG